MPSTGSATRIIYQQHNHNSATIIINYVHEYQYMIMHVFKHYFGRNCATLVVDLTAWVFLLELGHIIFGGSDKNNNPITTIKASFSVNSYWMQHNRTTEDGQPHKRWVLGLVDTYHTPALGYMEIAQQRDTATLLSIRHSGTHSSRNNHLFRWLECIP